MALEVHQPNRLDLFNVNASTVDCRHVLSIPAAVLKRFLPPEARELEIKLFDTVLRLLDRFLRNWFVSSGEHGARVS